MINILMMTGKVLDTWGGVTHVIGVIECNGEQFYILFDSKALPEPKKILNKYVSVTGSLSYFKHKRPRDKEYAIDLGIFVRRLEVYDV